MMSSRVPSQRSRAGNGPVWQARGNVVKQLGGDQADLLSDIVVKGQAHHDLTIVSATAGASGTGKER